MTLANRTIIMSGGSRGIGEAIAVRAAQDGANVALLAKSAEPHPKLPGTIYSAAEAIENAGGRALPLVGDIRDDEFVSQAVDRTASEFGGIDIVVNNASAIDLSSTDDLAMKKYDLMLDINARGSFLLSKLALPHLRNSDHAHILTLSPPIRLEPEKQLPFTGYTMSKFAMSVVTLALSQEVRADDIAVNSLWPRTAIDTAAVRNVVGGDFAVNTRTPAIMADAAHAILLKPTDHTGHFHIDEDVLRTGGLTDFSAYAHGPEEDLAPDFWV